MKCIKCKTVNIHNANYCKKCAYEFSEKEQESAEKWTFIGILKRLENFKEKVTFGWLIDHWAFKIGSIIGVLLIGIWFVLNNGTAFAIAESDNYTANYNGESNEYYLYSEKEKAELNLYIPKKVENLTIKHYDGNSKVISDLDYSVTDNIILYSNGNNDYYVLEANYSDDKSDKLKLFIYQEKDGE